MRAQSLGELVELGALPEDAAAFLDAAVQAGLNMLVSGPTGSGKTTLLNALGASIASLDERVVTVEEVPELLARSPAAGLRGAAGARQATSKGSARSRIRDLVRNALRMRPTRIVVGEVRGAEALDMLLAMNTGHEGSLTTIHGNSPRDALDRLATLAMMAGERLASEELARMVARTIELVVQLRVADAHRSAPRGEHLRGHRPRGGVIAATRYGASSTAGWSGAADRRAAWRKMAARGIEYAPPARRGATRMRRAASAALHARGGFCDARLATLPRDAFRAFA